MKKEAEILHNYYKPEMQKIYKLIYPELPLSEFCENEKRYKWLKTYLCETNNEISSVEYEISSVEYEISSVEFNIFFLLISLCFILYVQYVFM